MALKALFIGGCADGQVREISDYDAALHRISVPDASLMIGATMAEPLMPVSEYSTRTFDLKPDSRRPQRFVVCTLIGLGRDEIMLRLLMTYAGPLTAYSSHGRDTPPNEWLI